MNDYSKILWEAYKKFLLPLGGKKVHTPYRINIPFQPDRRKYGKSDPDTLTKDVIELAQQQMFDLENASVDQISKFMGKNMLGIDCSGFVYHLLDYLLKKIGKGGMEEAGFPKASQTNSKLLSSEKFTSSILPVSDIRVADLIFFNQASDENIPHIMIVLDKNDTELTYAQSTKKSEPKGTQIKKINIINPEKGLKDQQWEERLKSGKLRSDYFNPQAGDGIYRLLMLK